MIQTDQRQFLSPFSGIFNLFHQITAIRSNNILSGNVILHYELINQNFMKQLVGLMIAMAIFAGCQKDDIGGSSSTTRVNIVGKLPVTRSATINGELATKVLLFDTSGEITVSDIIDGTFQVQVNKDEPVGLIFSNEAKNFLGYLTLGQKLLEDYKKICLPVIIAAEKTTTVNAPILKNKIDLVLIKDL